MRALSVRVGVILAAVGLVGAVILDVIFLLHAQSEQTRLRRLTTENAALELATRFPAGDGFEDQMREIARRHGVVLSWVGQRGTVQTRQLELPPLDEGGGILAGYEHRVIALNPVDHVVASQALSDGVSQAFSQNRSAVLSLALTLLLTVGLSLAFIRRAVLRPIQRMTDVVATQDHDALTRFGLAGSDDLAKLGRAIVSMNERVEGDKQQIAEQLEALQSAHHELETAHGQLVRAERLAVVGQLAAGLAHEVGNPIAILSGYMDVAAGGDLNDAELTDMLARMRKETTRIHDTLRALLDFSRAEQAAAGSGDVAAVLAHLDGLLAPQERMRGVELELPALSSPVMVGVSENALTQVLLNLMLNAADACAGEGKIRVSVSAGGSRVSLTVEDSGPGIPEAERARVFEPFYSTKAAGKGTGLGLSVCERIITSAGGDIELEESELGGARFSLILPVPTAAAR